MINRSREGEDLGTSRPLSEIKAELFKALAHPGRVRILEILSQHDTSVAELSALVGLEPAHVSQQLGVLRRGRIVTPSRTGSSVVYSIADPAIKELLAVARQFLLNSLNASQDLLADLQDR